MAYDFLKSSQITPLGRATYADDEDEMSVSEAINWRTVRPIHYEAQYDREDYSTAGYGYAYSFFDPDRQHMAQVIQVLVDNRGYMLQRRTGKTTAILYMLMWEADLGRDNNSYLIVTHNQNEVRRTIILFEELMCFNGQDMFNSCVPAPADYYHNGGMNYDQYAGPGHYAIDQARLRVREEEREGVVIVNHKKFVFSSIGALERSISGRRFTRAYFDVSRLSSGARPGTSRNFDVAVDSLRYHQAQICC